MPIHYAALHHERSVLRGKAGLSPAYPEDLANEPIERLEPLPYRPADHARDKYLAVTIASKPGSTWNLLGGSPQASSRNSAAAGLQRQGTMGSWSPSFRLARDYQRHLSAGLKFRLPGLLSGPSARVDQVGLNPVAQPSNCDLVVVRIKLAIPSPVQFDGCSLRGVSALSEGIDRAPATTESARSL
jgi:hypothetical protein